MGTVRRTICLILGVWLLLSGCDYVDVAQSSSVAPPPPEVALRTPIALPTAEQEADPEEVPAAVSELKPVRLRIEQPPLPPPEPKPPPPPPSKSAPKTEAKQPTFAAKTDYPKAAPPPGKVESVPEPPPPSFALENSYPKALPPAPVVAKAEAASQELDRAVQSGELLVRFHGTGDRQKMVHFYLVNASDKPMKVRLVPGMILNPADQQRVQPLLVTEDLETVLQPGDSRAASLSSYCMDSRVPAPLPGQPVDYRFSKRTKDGGPEAVLAHQVAQEVAKSSPYRHAVTQIAIWKSLKQPVGEEQLRSVLGRSYRDPRVRQEVLREVDKVLSRLSASS